LSEATEDYLKVIYTLQATEGKVTTSALARRLGVAPASVSGMLAKLAKQGLINHRRYQGAVLTSEGRLRALQVIRRHRLAELWLRRILGLPLHRVHDEAHKLEHALSDEVASRLDELLEHPERDPHGTPIPTADGRLVTDSVTPLAEVAVGQSVVIREVCDDDPAAVRFLEERGLLPAVRIEVIARQPCDGPFTLRVGQDEHILGLNITRQILVEIDPDLDRNISEPPGSVFSSDQEES